MYPEPDSVVLGCRDWDLQAAIEDFRDAGDVGLLREQRVDYTCQLYSRRSLGVHWILTLPEAEQGRTFDIAILILDQYDLPISFLHLHPKTPALSPTAQRTRIHTL